MSVTLSLPLPSTDTPLVPAVTFRVPDTTDRLAVRIPAPASTSAMLSPVPSSARLICSVAA